MGLSAAPFSETELTQQQVDVCVGDVQATQRVVSALGEIIRELVDDASQPHIEPNERSAQVPWTGRRHSVDHFGGFADELSGDVAPSCAWMKLTTACRSVKRFDLREAMWVTWPWI
jgi:hypothetical protein